MNIVIETTTELTATQQELILQKTGYCVDTPIMNGENYSYFICLPDGKTEDDADKIIELLGGLIIADDIYCDDWW